MVRRIYILFFFFTAVAIWPLSLFSQASKAAADPPRRYPEAGFDVLKYALDADLYPCYAPPYPASFAASLTITLRAEQELTRVQLNASSRSLRIDSVSGAGNSFSHVDDLLTMETAKRFFPGDTLILTIRYHHLNVADHAFYASAGYVFTDSPAEGARKWFPCLDRPSDKALWDLHAKVPSLVRLGSNGLLTDSVMIADTIIYHWESLFPVSTYLITIASHNGYQIYRSYWHKNRNAGDSIPVLLFHNPGESHLGTDTLIGPLTDFYSELFGDYSFEKIGFATLDGSFPWGGMENQTMVNLMTGGYSDPELIAHEHAHQWFGDLITCGTWADVWLNEGFGTYCTNLWTGHLKGYEAYKRQMELRADNYLNTNPGFALYNPSWILRTPSADTIYNGAISYDKGACVLHQLRYVLGDSLFFRVLKSYATDPDLRYKNAVTEDFVRVASKVSGQDLSWFFDEWVYRPDHPVYENSAEIKKSHRSWHLRFTIRQVQARSGFYKMPVQISVRFTDGSDTLMRVVNDANPQSYEFSFAKEPAALVFDPFRNILLKRSATVMTGIPGKRKE